MLRWKFHFLIFVFGFCWSSQLRQLICLIFKNLVLRLSWFFYFWGLACFISKEFVFWIVFIFWLWGPSCQRLFLVVFFSFLPNLRRWSLIFSFWIFQVFSWPMLDFFHHRFVNLIAKSLKSMAWSRSGIFFVDPNILIKSSIDNLWFPSDVLLDDGWGYKGKFYRGIF